MPSDADTLLAMLGQPRPEGGDTLCAEVLAEVDLPPGGLQLAIGRAPALPACCAGHLHVAGDDGASNPGERSACGSCGPSRGEECRGGTGKAESGSSEGGGHGGTGASRGLPVGAPVRWLPPLRVTATLPAGYPSQEPPAVRVAAGWLRPAQAEALTAHAPEAWAQQGEGFPVLFAYLEWLREAALTHLGVKDTLLLTGSGGVSSSGCDGGDGEAQEAPAAPCGSMDAAAAVGGGGGREKGSEGCGGEGEGEAAVQAAGPSAEQIAMQLLMYHASKEQVRFAPQQRRWRWSLSARAHRTAAFSSRPPCLPPPPLNSSLYHLPLFPHPCACAVHRVAPPRQEEFDASQQRCAVCFDEQPGSMCVRLPGCRHFYCRVCLQQLAATNVKEGSVEALR
jgi:hypothetical protein